MKGWGSTTFELNGHDDFSTALVSCSFRVLEQKAQGEFSAELYGTLSRRPLVIFGYIQWIIVISNPYHCVFSAESSCRVAHSTSSLRALSSSSRVDSTRSKGCCCPPIKRSWNQTISTPEPNPTQWHRRQKRNATVSLGAERRGLTPCIPSRGRDLYWKQDISYNITYENSQKKAPLNSPGSGIDVSSVRFARGNIALDPNGVSNYYLQEAVRISEWPIRGAIVPGADHDIRDWLRPWIAS